jgi:hypothetical protein
MTRSSATNYQHRLISGEPNSGVVPHIQLSQLHRSLASSTVYLLPILYNIDGYMHANDAGLKEKKKVRFDLCSYSATQQEMALKNFDPEAFLANWSEEFVPTEGRPFARCFRAAFKISQQDAYEYRAQGVTTLDMTQAAINAKRKNGMHDWYHDEEGKIVCLSSIAIIPTF